MDVIIYKENCEGDDMEVGKVRIDMNEFGHELCMGIRAGLFGVQADSHASIKDENDTCCALREIADAINNLAQSIKER